MNFFGCEKVSGIFGNVFQKFQNYVFSFEIDSGKRKMEVVRKLSVFKFFLDNFFMCSSRSDSSATERRCTTSKRVSGVGNCLVFVSVSTLQIPCQARRRPSSDFFTIRCRFCASFQRKSHAATVAYNNGQGILGVAVAVPGALNRTT